MFLAIFLLAAADLPSQEEKKTAPSTTPSEAENIELRKIISILSTELGAPEEMKEKVSVNLVNADLRAVIVALAEKHGINLYGGQKITGSVTARLKNVPLETLLRILLRSNGYEMVRRDDLFYEVLTKADADAEKKEKEIASMAVRSFDIKYADLESTAEILTKIGILGSETKVGMSPETNQLIVQATQEELDAVEKLLKDIDIQPPQILIRARIMEMSEDASEKLGIQATADWLASRINYQQTVAIDLSQTSTAGEVFTFGVTRPEGGLGALASMTIEALKEEGLANILSAPRLTTTNNKEASLTVADRIPVITRQKTVTEFGAIEIIETVSFQDSGLTLKILPRKVGTNQILLSIDPTITQLSGFTSTDPPQPILDTRESHNEVIVRDNEWLVIGGLTTTHTSDLRRKFPILGDIPLLGIAFRSSRDIRTKNDLLILVNAHILDRKEEKQASKVKEQEYQVVRDNPEREHLHPEGGGRNNR